MSDSGLTNLYRQIVLEHAKNPRHFQENLGDSVVKLEKYNPSCGDIIQVQIKVVDQTVQAISFDGNGCAISMAAASMMMEELTGKSVQQAKKTLKMFSDMLMGQNHRNQELGELSTLSGVRQFPTRIKCATLASHAIQELMTQF